MHGKREREKKTLPDFVPSRCGSLNLAHNFFVVVGSGRKEPSHFRKVNFSVTKQKKKDFWGVFLRLLYYAKARLHRSELLWNVSCRWVLQIAFYFCPFWPIWPILAWADRPVCSSLIGLREERKKYSIGKLGYARVCAKSSRKWNSTTAEVVLGFVFPSFHWIFFVLNKSGHWTNWMLILGQFPFWSQCSIIRCFLGCIMKLNLGIYFLVSQSLPFLFPLPWPMDQTHVMTQFIRLQIQIPPNGRGQISIHIGIFCGYFMS